MVKHPLHTCLSGAICSVRSEGSAARAGVASRPQRGAPGVCTVRSCGSPGRTVALKPRPTHRWPVRARDVPDVIQQASGEGRGRGVAVLHSKSTLWPWQRLWEILGLAASHLFSPAVWLGSGNSSSPGAETGVNSAIVPKPALPSAGLIPGAPLCPCACSRAWVEQGRRGAVWATGRLPKGGLAETLISAGTVYSSPFLPIAGQERDNLNNCTFLHIQKFPPSGSKT